MQKTQVFPLRLLFFVVLFVLVSHPILSVDGAGNSSDKDTALCPGIVTQAMDATDASCRSTSRNRLCYGHNLVQVEPQSFVSRLTFNVPGDTVPVAQVRTVRGSALDVNDATWGVALMRVQADLPDSLPDQNLTFLLFGDAEITQSVTKDMTTIPLMSAAPTNIRSAPGTNYPVLASIASGQALVATGRLPDTSWLRVWLPGQENGAMGWVSASLVTASADTNSLNIIDGSAGTPSLGHLDAFYLKTSERTTQCEQFPSSGLLIQTPEGAGTVRLYINEVRFDIGSTVFLQAQADGAMTVSTLEGMARVESAGHTEVAVAGSQLNVPLDIHMAASGPPSIAKPYAQEEFQSLPTANLQRPITVAPPLTAPVIQIAHDLTQANQPVCGPAPLPTCSTIVVEGMIQSVSPQTIRVNGVTIVVAGDNPIRSMLAVETRVHVEGNLNDTGTEIIPTKIIILSPPPVNPANPPNPPTRNGMGPANNGGNNDNKGMGMGMGNDEGNDGMGMGMGNDKGNDGMGMGHS